MAHESLAIFPKNKKCGLECVSGKVTLVREENCVCVLGVRGVGI